MSRKNFAKKHGRAVLPGQHWDRPIRAGETPNIPTIGRVMAVAEGYVMMRKRGAAPFLLTVKDLDDEWHVVGADDIRGRAKV